MFSSITFIILALKFRFMIHFGYLLNMEWGQDQDSFHFLFLFLSYAIQLFQHHLLKGLSFPHWIACAYLLKINLPYLCRSISAFCSVNSILSVFTLIPHCVITVSHKVLKSGSISPSTLLFLISFGYSRQHFHRNFRTSLVISTKWISFDFY